jgi:succinyl-CoA synthetase beta subunit
VAHSTPEKIISQPIDINKGIQDADTLKIAQALGFKGAEIKEAQAQMKGLYELFIKEEAVQVEINPLAHTRDGKVWCVDAKIVFDDNASFRHEDIFSQRDTSMEDSREVAASQFGLNYIGLDGNIGCMGQCFHRGGRLLGVVRFCTDVFSLSSPALL